MSHISKTLLDELQTELLNTFAQLRMEIVDILKSSTHTSHQVIAEQLKKVSADELVELTSKFAMPAISDKTGSIKSIDAALNNIQIDMYGLCSDCEREIDIEQLKANPTQQRCPECERKYQKQKYNNYKL